MDARLGKGKKLDAILPHLYLTEPTSKHRACTSSPAVPRGYLRPRGIVPSFLPTGRAVGVPAEPKGVCAPGDSVSSSPSPALAVFAPG